jgi:hypothetical protein
VPSCASLCLKKLLGVKATGGKETQLNCPLLRVPDNDDHDDDDSFKVVTVFPELRCWQARNRLNHLVNGIVISIIDKIFNYIILRC